MFVGRAVIPLEYYSACVIYIVCIRIFIQLVGYNLNNWPGAADKTKPQELTWTHSGLIFLLSVSTVIKVLLYY